MMIFFILLLFYVQEAMVEDEFDSDNFEDFYTVIPVLSEMKYPEMFLERGKSFKRHIKLNETKEAFQSETTQIVFDLLKKLNLSIDDNLVANLKHLGNKFNMNVSLPELVLKKSGSAKADNEISTSTTQHNADDNKSVVTATSFNRSRQPTCVTIIKKDENFKTTATPQIQTTKRRRTGSMVKIVQVPGIWFDGQCRCNYIFRSGSNTINPNLYFIIFFDILTCVFGK